MKRPIKIERAKTIFIVVLFLMTILLLYFLWKDTKFGNISLQIDLLNRNQSAAAPEISAIIKPARLVVNFGGDSHTILESNQHGYWDTFVAEFNKFAINGTITVSEITKTQFDEAVKGRSLRAEFDYWLPFRETLTKFDIAQGADYSKVEDFSTVAYSVAVPDSLLIYDGNNKKYYRLASDKGVTNIGTIIDNIEANSLDSYFPMGTYLGIDNPSLMPISLKSNMKAIAYDSEIKYYEENKIVDFAKKFFGEGFDFVRKITENNGTTLYMYGYGEKILIIDKLGSIEYKEELDDSSYTPLKYYESLDLAMQFISMHGGWGGLNGMELSPYLKKVSAISDGSKKGYQFTFGMEINDEPLYYTNNDEILSVRVIGEYVSGFKRDMPDITKGTLDQLASEDLRETLDPINILTENYKYIKTVLNKNGINITGNTDAEVFENIASMIDKIQTGYVKADNADGNQDQLVYPAWIFTAGKFSIYFNIYTGEPLGISGSMQEAS